VPTEAPIAGVVPVTVRLRIKPSRPVGTKPAVARTSRPVSKSPTSLTRAIRSDLKRIPWPTIEPFVLGQLARDARLKRTAVSQRCIPHRGHQRACSDSAKAQGSRGQSPRDNYRAAARLPLGGVGCTAHPLRGLELTASRYEILCGRQGARGVADPALLESFIDAPAAYSTTGREAFMRQQEQAIRNAARIAGGRSRSGSSRTGWRGGWRRSYQQWWRKCKRSPRPIP
jgi:hypothetical protein